MKRFPHRAPKSQAKAKLNLPIIDPPKELYRYNMAIFITKIRELCGLSIEEASEVLQIDLSDLRKYENNKQGMNSSTLSKIIYKYHIFIEKNGIQIPSEYATTLYILTSEIRS